MGALSDSVGRKGANLKQDVAIVQRLLRTAGYEPGGEEGFCGDDTIAAIEEFQSSIGEHSTGLVETNSPTLRRLAEAQRRAVSEEVK